MYQSDLCSAMLDQLEGEFGKTGRLTLSFNSRVFSVDPLTAAVVVKTENGQVKGI